MTSDKVQYTFQKYQGFKTRRINIEWGGMARERERERADHSTSIIMDTMFLITVVQGVWTFPK